MSISDRDRSDKGVSGREMKLGSSSTGSALFSGALSISQDEVDVEGWKDLPKRRNARGRKRVWIGADGQLIAGAYKVGWEREVLDA